MMLQTPHGTLNARTVKLYFYRFQGSSYYSLSIYIGIIIICFLLLLFLVIPQIQQVFSIKNEIAATRQRTTVLQNNISYMTGLDEQALDDNLQLASSALPSDKDASAILQAISDS